MFTIIVIAAAVFIINKNDLTPAPQKFTRSPHRITAAVARQEVTYCQKSVLAFFSMPKEGERLWKHSFPLCTRLASIPIWTAQLGRGFGKGFSTVMQQRPGGSRTLRSGEQGVAHPLTCLLSG